MQIIHNNRNGETTMDENKFPLLVYMSREKRPLHPHRFKAGALNSLVCIQ